MHIGFTILLLMIFHKRAVLYNFPSKCGKENTLFVNSSIKFKEGEKRSSRTANKLHCMKKQIKKNQFHDRCAINRKNKKYASGGRGGKGGNVYLIGDKKIDNFLSLKLKSFYYAGNGGKGLNNNQNGENGKDECINIPVNTIIYDEEKKFVNFIHLNGQTVLIALGGKGGKGNYSYRTKSLKIPFVCQFGEKTKEKKIFLKKIFFTDFGIIGYPNVGKSTLLNRITNANVKIANYSYTSKFPNLGIFRRDRGEEAVLEENHLIGENEEDEAVLEENHLIGENEEDEAVLEENHLVSENEAEEAIWEDNREEAEDLLEGESDSTDDTTHEEGEKNITKNNYTVIDFPGIIKNLDKKVSNISYKYLEHLKYCKILIYMFDINSSSDVLLETYRNIKDVLVQYDPIFKGKKEVVLLNKIDIYKGKKDNVSNVINHLRENLKIENIFCISALTGENAVEAINEIVSNINDENSISEFLKSLPEPIDIAKIEDSDNFRPSQFEIYKYKENVFIVKGKYIENQANIFNFSKSDTSKIFAKILDHLNINVKLKNVGAREGDRIIISNYSYEFSLEGD
ncbi:GTP-binding protein [Plasmodium cynomolgi strain B]|uniref:GTP-binding protein n=1 Tax=Plasmodium cynomolgi (strain B) TaxID=1120755 RepID=K6VGW5_PLACD|nr:GTP-binding protein [Plasmodium cynomolgi strain B]GAB68577.1 GTP-binding protein [Plasmodium cynomolgi strain B]